MTEFIPELDLMQDLLGFRFGVTFLAAGVLPNPLDTRFRRISGLTATVNTTAHLEGGQNLYTQKLPTSIEYDNLVLERGLVVGSPLNVEFNLAMSTFQFLPSNVLVSLLNEESKPVCGWLFIKAYPVKWTTSDLNADEKDLMIDTLELAYSRMQIMEI